MIDYIYHKWMLIIISANLLADVYSVETVNIDADGAGLPCLGLQHELIGHDDVAVCAGSWTGNIKSANNICRSVWHLCTWDDVEVLHKISWYEATHVSGCYAINAAHDDRTCSNCEGKPREAEMAAIGADCVGFNKSSLSCFGGGRIDASVSHIPQYVPCHHAPWISGVLCCRNKIAENEPSIVVQPEESINVFEGSSVTLNCQATGEPKPTYKWFKNGSPVSIDKHIEEYSTIGSLTINSVATKDKGYWQCLAINSLGFSLSNGTRLNVEQFRKNNKPAIACRNRSRGRMLVSSDVAVCDGKWNGHVKRASNKICARGWKVCSVKNMHALNYVNWQEVTNITGCYAYNAASSKFYPCTTCRPNNIANRMSGIGAGCGNIQENGYSCMQRGRIDVNPKSQSQTLSRKRLRSCVYVEGTTTGVACCRKRIPRKTSTRRKGKSAGAESSCPCKNGGICIPGLTTCRCKQGYRGRFCQRVRKRILRMRAKRQKGIKCGTNKCVNNGVYYEGRCVCPQHYQGKACGIYHPTS
uniref:uncharacterized protein LOC120328109 isoform X1 n=1 Tax=Styela clava TaxID=7725 RepID=UPI0019393EBD|nr:uncharacterized protein LOC120328109 isoform X1 [Styela clava]